MKKTIINTSPRRFLVKPNSAPKRGEGETLMSSDAAENQKLIHKHEVHQVELEKMNDELTLAGIAALHTAEKYTQLFDFAPAGYFTLSVDGVVSEVNLSASEMLGKERFYLINRHFAFFVSHESKLIFNKFINDIFESKVKQSCEILLVNTQNAFQYVNLTGIIDINQDKCLVTMVDVTKYKKLAELNETLLTSLPYPAMYIRTVDRVILAANKMALDMGAKVGGQCWREFAKSNFISQQDKKIATKYQIGVPAEFGIKCTFCKADNCFPDLVEQRNTEIHAFNLIWDVYWIQVSKDVFLHYAVDITELKMAEAALKESELKFRTIADYTFDWELWVDLNDKILYCSPSCEKITGYKNYEFIENPQLRFDIIFPDDIVKFQLHKQKEEISQETNQEIQIRIVRNDRQIRWIGHVCRSVLDESGKFIGTRINNRDITRRKEMELLLLESEQKYKQLSENISDGVFMCRNGILVYVNTSMKSIFGYEGNEMEGMKITDLALPEYLDDLKNIIDLKTTINQTRNIELNCFKNDSSIVNVEITMNYLANNNDIYGVVHDITEKKKIQNRNIVKAIILTEEHEKSSFSKELHDGLGPLLSTIKLYLQWMERPKNEDMRLEIISKAQLVIEEALVSLSEISNKMSPHLLSENGLTSAMQGFINKFEGTSNININFYSNLTRRFNLEIEAALYRVIIECVNNSVKYAKANNIYIEFKDAMHQIVINYKDDGIGFDLIKTIAEQKGLGLNNLENRINGIGGEIIMYSQPGHGVDYRIRVFV